MIAATPNLVHADVQPWLIGRGGWTWCEPHRGEHFRRCDYCGCIHPDDLVAEPNWSPEWADRKYGWPHKFYIHIPDRSGLLDVVGSSNGDESPGDNWKRVYDLTDTEREACDKYHLDTPDMWVLLKVRTVHFAKFYTQHLADPAIGQDAKNAIHRIGGLTFEFLNDGRVSWRPWAA